jgi:alpha-galactosidase
MRNIRLALSTLILLLSPLAARAESPTPSEFDAARRWIAAAFEGHPVPPSTQTALEVVENHDPVQRNARAGKPLRIGDAQFTRGLYCHANSRVLVQNLRADAKTFSATIGVDSNEQTSGGRGSVIFQIELDGKIVFTSPLMHENSKAIPVSINLVGAHQLAIIVTDGGDGIFCDQSDWADAKITTVNGDATWLGELPFTRENAVASNPFLSLTIGGRPFAQVFAGVEPQRTTHPIDANRVGRTLIYRNPDVGLEVRCEGVEYRDFPTIEWTVYVKNNAPGDSPMNDHLLPLDLSLHETAPAPFILHHNIGSPAGVNDYQPIDSPLDASASMQITTTGGRSTNSNLPFFNIEFDGGGVIAALGWPGQWGARFIRDDHNDLHVMAGQQMTHFKLHPGEEVRTPLVVMQFYRGSPAHAQNVWRQWMIAHNMPHPFGKPPPPMTGACSSAQFHEMINATEASQIHFIDRYLEEKIPIDYWWMDAGWYVNNGDWPNTGTWEVDTKRFPHGLRAITDHAHAKGVKSIVWFEPERVNPGTWLYQHHPEWLLGKEGADKLLNLGNSDARQWWLEHADALINAQGIDLYRTDFNIDPLPYWRSNDAPDRQGITEIRYVEGLLGYWDELRQRHPDMLIDNCASGGRRNDLETLRRALPLLRSDAILEPTTQQNHTMGIASWIPYFGTAVNSPDAYAFHSQMCPWITCCYDMRRQDVDFAALRKLHAEWKEVSPLMLCDYYLLSTYATDNTVWAAWQWNDPAHDRGAIFAFRRPESIYESAVLKPRHIDPSGMYELKDLDTNQTRQIKGSELATHFQIELPAPRASKIFLYQKQ